MAAAFIRLFFVEKVEVMANINLKLSMIVPELKELLIVAGQQLEQRGPVLSRMMAAKVKFRKLNNFYVLKDY